MKKHMFVLTIFSSLLLISCDSEESSVRGESINDSEESLQNDKVSMWVKNNSAILETYNREELSTYPRTVQKAIMRSFSPEKRKNIWQSKIDYLLSAPDFSHDEKKHLQWFAETFRELSYDRAFDKKLSQEMYDKVIEGMESFGWSKSFAHKMFFSIEDINDDRKEKKKELSLAQIDDIEDDIDGPYCECYYDLGCPTWDCDSGNNCDDSPQNPHDCGVFGGTDCDGNC